MDIETLKAKLANFAVEFEELSKRRTSDYERMLWLKGAHETLTVVVRDIESALKDKEEPLNEPKPDGGEHPTTTEELAHSEGTQPTDGVEES